MSTALPFPSSGANGPVAPKGGQDKSDAMRIDIPKSKDETPQHGNNNPAQQHRSNSKQQHTTASHHHHDQSAASAAAVPVPPRGSSHHPRPPMATSDSYFPNSGSSSVASSTSAATSAQPPRTPGSLRNHSRQPSNTSINPSATQGRKQQQQHSHQQHSSSGAGHNMSLSLSSGGGQVNGSGPGPESFADFVGGLGHAGPPSPSTLTDIILGLHSTLYGGKRTAEEVREMVYRFYDQDAVFESPLLAALGREQIANQFIMAFTLPGMDVKSELRDVICSDFEFDGTRAGIIDQTISVTFLPGLFGSSSADQTSHAHDGQHPSRAPQEYDAHGRGGSTTPAYTLQSAITPHPFASYSASHTPAQGSTFSRYASQQHSPTTPYSMTSMWGASRPHTPGAASSHMRPLSYSHRPSTPPSVNGDDDTDAGAMETSTSTTVMGNEESHFMSANEAGGGQVSRPAMPADALQPHWSAKGLGRSSVRALLWGIFHPRAVLKHLCTIQLRLMSRLEFNDAGLIVRHEDTWGVRETIEGVVPFASLIYALERRVVGYICSFAVGRGFRLSSALTRHAIGPAADQYNAASSYWQQLGNAGSGDRFAEGNANEAAHALLLGYNRHEKMQSMARSRAASPSRQRFFTHGNAPHTAHSGGRSRARSLIGGPHSAAPTRTASSDNLLSIAYGTSYGERERTNTHGGETLPPDSSARYRTGSRRITTSTSSAPVGGPIGLGTSLSGSSGLDSGGGAAWQQADPYLTNLDGPGTSMDGKTRAPDRDGHERY